MEMGNNAKPTRLIYLAQYSAKISKGSVEPNKLWKKVKELGDNWYHKMYS